ncbi:unnamed protein product, partial [Meganyctiphanes norvegica]
MVQFTPLYGFKKFEIFICIYNKHTLRLMLTNVHYSRTISDPIGYESSFLPFTMNKIERNIFAIECIIRPQPCKILGIKRTGGYKEWGHIVVAPYYCIMTSTDIILMNLATVVDYIWENVEGGAFVYGFMSFVEKVSTGTMIMVIQYIGDNESEGSNFYQMVITYACGSSCILGTLVIITLIISNLVSSKGYILEDKAKCLPQHFFRQCYVKKESILVTSIMDGNGGDEEPESGVKNTACDDKDDTVSGSDLNRKVTPTETAHEKTLKRYEKRYGTFL